MDQTKLAILQLLQDFLDEKAKAEAERFLSDFIVGSMPYNEGLGYVTINKIDADLVCRGELPICQPLRDFLAVCVAKDLLDEKLMSSNVVCTGLGINCFDCNIAILQKELNIDLDKTGAPSSPSIP